MDSINSDFSHDEDFGSEADGPTNEANSTFTKSEAFTYMKDFGKKGLQPLFGVISKYQVDLNPYLSALDTGLKAAVTALTQETATESDREVSKWFTQASGFITTAGEKLKSTNPTDLWHFFEEEARRQPGLMFSASYVAGLLFGRLGRHVGSQVAGQERSDTSDSQMDSQFDTQLTPKSPDFPETSNIH